MNNQMYNKKALMSSLPMVASILGRQHGIKVTIGQREYASTDGNTIHLPSLPVDADETTVNLIRGYIDHEAGHIRFSNLPAWAAARRQGLRALAEHFTNIIEDYRIENCMAEIYPGCRGNFSFLNHYLYDTSVPVLPPDKVAYLIPSWFLRALHGGVSPRLAVRATQYEKKLEVFFPGLVKVLTPLVDEAAECSSTEEVIALARQIMAVLEQFLIQSNMMQPGEGDNSEDLGFDGQGDEQQNNPTKNQGGGHGQRQKNSKSAGTNQDVQCSASQDSSNSRQEKERTNQDKNGSDSDSGEKDQLQSEGQQNALDNDSDTDSQDGQGEEESSPGQKSSDPSGDSNSPKNQGEKDKSGSQSTGTADSQMSNGNGNQGGQQSTSGQASQESSNSSDDASTNNDSGAGGLGASSAPRSMETSSKSSLESLIDGTDPSLIPENAGDTLKEALNHIGATTPYYEALRVSQKVEIKLESLSPNILTEAKTATRALSARLQGLLQSMDMRRRVNTRRGRLDTGKMYRLRVGNPRLFTRETESIGVDTLVYLLMDRSGSMHGSMSLACAACYAVASALKPIKGVRTGVSVFPGDPTEDCTVGEILRPDEPLHDKFGTDAEGGTPMGEAIWWVLQQVIHEPEKRKMVLVITDGMPDDENVTAEAILAAKKLGVELHGIGIGSYSSCLPSLIPNSKIVENIKELAPAVIGILQDALTDPELRRR